MGWLFTRGSTRKELITEQTKNWTANGPDDTTVNTTCLAHCYRGGRFSGVLWSVWERTFVRNGEAVQPTERWITCNLLRCRKDDGWGYKDLDESMHPFYYSCPLRYLNLVPIEVHGGCKEWREGVRRYHARQRETRRQPVRA